MSPYLKKIISDVSTGRHYFKHACITRISSYFKDFSSPLRHEVTLNYTTTRPETYRKYKLSVFCDDYYRIISIKPLCFPIVYHNIVYDILWRRYKSHRRVLLRLMPKIDNNGSREHSYIHNSMMQLYFFFICLYFLGLILCQVNFNVFVFYHFSWHAN